MQRLQGKKLAFAFSDPAGANACAAAAKFCELVPGQTTVLFSNRKYDTLPHNEVWFTETVPDWRELEIDLLFTGTSHPQSSRFFEVECIAKAKEQGIPTISFVDHWVNFRLRFLNESDQLVYPDAIWVVDEKAKELAIAEGLPEDRIEVTGNPYHQYLQELWQPQFTRREYLKALGFDETRFTIVFAPDPLSLRGGKETVGFTEDEALQTLLSVLAESSVSIQLIIKCHPLQPTGIFEKLIGERSFPVYLLQSTNTLELLQAADLVIGFYSNILLEAEALGKTVLRYFPGRSEADLLRHKTALPLARTSTELDTLLNPCLHG